MAGERHEVKHTHMDHRLIVGLEEGSRFITGWLDIIMQQNRTTANSHVLGEIYIGQVILGRNAWLVRSTPLCQESTVRFRSGKLPYAATTRERLSSTHTPAKG